MQCPPSFFLKKISDKYPYHDSTTTRQTHSKTHHQKKERKLSITEPDATPVDSIFLWIKMLPFLVSCESRSNTSRIPVRTHGRERLEKITRGSIDPRFLTCAPSQVRRGNCDVIQRGRGGAWWVFSCTDRNEYLLSNPRKKNISWG